MLGYLERKFIYSTRIRNETWGECGLREARNIVEYTKNMSIMNVAAKKQKSKTKTVKMKKKNVLRGF